MKDEHNLTPKMKGKAFIEGFKGFIFKGNVVDMAIGVIIGGAFGKIVTSLVNDIILPPIGVLLGGVDFKDLKWLIHQNPVLDDSGNQVIVDGIAQFNQVFIYYGNFIQIVLEFLIIAFVIYFTLFFIIRKKQFEEEMLKKLEPVEPKVEETPKDILLLTEIRDLLKKDEK
ncbi:MAG: large-conductance mechanosensitive channel protein MscL [Acholeplasmataceae bacterium]